MLVNYQILGNKKVLTTIFEIVNFHLEENYVFVIFDEISFGDEIKLNLRFWTPIFVGNFEDFLETLAADFDSDVFTLVFGPCIL